MRTITTRGTARKSSLEVLTLLADSMAQCPDEKGEVDQSNPVAALSPAWYPYSESKKTLKFRRSTSLLKTPELYQ